jgi:ABC-type transport system involved in multi-copper enzyme maturation permease subunit
MLNLLRAEWQKIIGHGLLTSFTLWVFPVGALAFSMFAVLWVLVSPDTMLSTNWQRGMLAAWRIITGFPGNVLTRMFSMAFLAAFIAGEYEAKTWKNTVPRSRRSVLLLAKFIMLPVMLILSLAATSLIWGVGMWLPAAIAGADYGPRLTGEVLGAFVPDYLLEMGLALATAFVMTGFAALAVLLTRTVVGGLILGMGMSIIEVVFAFLIQFISFAFNRPEWANLYAYTPTFSVENIRSWVYAEVALDPEFVPSFTAAHTLPFSIAVLLVWIVVLVVLSIVIFERQDLTS